jgi:hypothetical protein
LCCLLWLERQLQLKLLARHLHREVVLSAHKDLQALQGHVAQAEALQPRLALDRAHRGLRKQSRGTAVVSEARALQTCCHRLHASTGCPTHSHPSSSHLCCLHRDIGPDVLYAVHHGQWGCCAAVDCQALQQEQRQRHRSRAPSSAALRAPPALLLLRLLRVLQPHERPGTQWWL